MKKIFLLFFFLLISLPVFGVTVFTAELGKTELELDFQAYYTSLGWYLPLSSEEIPTITPEIEGEIYGFLMKRFFKPRYVVLESSIYPLPLLGVGIQSYLPEVYEAAEIRSVNLVESLASGPFMEPWAFSLFFGNVVNFNTENDTNHIGVSRMGLVDYEGKGYSGILISYGTHHILNCELYSADWIETEIKLKGSRKNDNLMLSYSYRVGSRVHFHEDIKSYVYIGVMRENLDKTFYKWSFAKNSYIDFRLDMQTTPFNILRGTLVIGKKFPLKNRIWIPEIKLGFEYNLQNPYRGDLAAIAENDPFRLIITPNVRF